MEITTESLAVMGASLANGGLCPTNGERVFKSESVRDVLSLMYTCGMYNYSGEFAFTVGLPAKSGVSGALVLVIVSTFLSTKVSCLSKVSYLFTKVSCLFTFLEF